MKENLVYIISDIDKAVFFELTADFLQNEFNLSFLLINCRNSALEAYLKNKGIPYDHIDCVSISKSGRAIQKAKKILQEGKCDIVHCHMTTANWVGLIAAKRVGVPQRIYTRHSGKPLVYRWKEKVIDNIQNRLATKIVAISKNTEYLLLNQNVPSSKIIRIEHGFDVKRFSHPDNKESKRIKWQYNPENASPVIGVIARWTEWKGIHYILQAFIDYLGTYPDAKICLFGGEIGDYAPEIEKLLAQIPHHNKLSVPFENNVYELYDLFDTYIHTPVNQECEAFGQTYVEAFLKRKNCIFTKSGIAAEFIEHKKNAYVVDFRNSQQILEGLHYFSKPLTEHGEMSTKGFKDASERFSLDHYSDKLKKMYHSR